MPLQTRGSKIIVLTGTWAFLFSLVGFPFLCWFLLNEIPPKAEAERTFVTNVVQPGGTLLLRNGFTGPQRCARRTFRSAYDSTGEQVFSDSDYIPAMLMSSPVIREIIISKRATPGPARYSTVIEWSCNWVQRLVPRTVVLPDLFFLIKE